MFVLCNKNQTFNRHSMLSSIRLLQTTAKQAVYIDSQAGQLLINLKAFTFILCSSVAHVSKLQNCQVKF